jgi:hypothetical protein
MQATSNMDWIVNLEEKTCHNINTDIVVVFEKTGDAFSGKIKELPDKIFEQWSKMENAGSLLKNIVTEAEDVFSRVFIENDLNAN